ncbi:MAG: hypothetical protein IJW52_01075 [Clostridia bacterium]|nr:hypothetical protein [Clostridia bacterium]
MKNIVNIINFVRAIEPRPNRNIDMQEPMREQIRILRENGLRGTFLLQYDTLIDPAFDTLIEDAASFCEIGLWLEIVKPQVEAIGLEWKGRYPWDWYNDVGFLIGYEPEQRFRLIDVAMERFRERFGHYPESVGSWHIDAVSLKYLDDKYKINAACICRDQVGTDGYTMQGGYYNQAYYPSVNNMFCPAATKEKQINIPVFRMLGSDPVLAYDYQLVNYGQTQCPTLEPSQLARFNDWTDWFFEAMFEQGHGLCFQYTQAGQENSFGWQRMKGGLEYQMPLIAKKADEGVISVMTLGESGKWYKSRFDSTPAATAVGLGAWKHPALSSVWYYCKRYRVNLFLDGKVARFRDTYIFDEDYREHYLDTRCDTHACEFRNLPVMDGVIYSNAAEDILAGVYFTRGGERIEWDEMRYRELSESVAEVTLISADGCARVLFSEDGIEISADIDGFALTPEYDRERVYGYVNEGDLFANHNNKKTALSFIDRAVAERDKIVFSMNGFEYGVKVAKGRVGEDFSIGASDGKIKLMPF